MKQNQRLLTILTIVALGVGAVLLGAWHLSSEPVAAAAGGATGTGSSGSSAPLRFIEGRSADYIEVDNPLPAKEGEIEVELFFWYGCPACYTTDPDYNRWGRSLPDDVKFIRTPAVFSATHEMHGRIHYAIQALGLDEEAVSNRVFREIHEKRNLLTTEQQIIRFLANAGVKRQNAERVFRSFALAAKTREARTRAKRLMISGTPALTVGGRYLINTATPQRAAEVAMFLLNKIRSEQAQKAQRP